MRIVLLVKFNADFITLVFALLKVGVAVVLIDPGMGRKSLLQCLEESNPDGFVAIPLAQAIRGVLRKRFSNAKLNVTVGPRFGFLPGPTLSQLRRTPARLLQPPTTSESDPAAIIFTTGSTGPPKGVLYTHQTFNQQIDRLVEHYHIQPGGRDLSGFPLFGLFNAVMGTTTIIPDMNPTKPADVKPPRLLDAIDQWQINQAFGSPALWTAVGKYCEQTGRRVPSLKLVLSAGAPVPPRVLKWIRGAMADDGQVFTPYGATEALPVASIESREVLDETQHASVKGAGTCVGRTFTGIEWKVIQIEDGPIEDISQAKLCQVSEIGELMVRGKVVTEKYVTRVNQNAIHKVQDGDTFWHRMGDLGYLDAQNRFWFCGRKSHRVRTTHGDLFTIPCEAIFNQHPRIHRTALIGVGEMGSQKPVIVAEPWPDMRPKTEVDQQKLVGELLSLAEKNSITASIKSVLIYPQRLPTDIRHNAKIFRENLVPWADQQLASITTAAKR